MKLPTNILYVHSSDGMYGADLILLQLIDTLDRGLFAPIVILPNDVPDSGLLTKALLERGIKPIHMQTAVLRRAYMTPSGLLRYGKRFITTVYALVKIIHKHKIGIVHSNSISVIPGAVAAKLSGIPHVWHIHEILLTPRFIVRFTAWLVPRLSRQVVAVSNPVYDNLCKNDPLNKDKATVIHNGIDLQRFTDVEAEGIQIRRSWMIPDDVVLIGMVGRILKWKGQDHFLNACQIVAKDHEEARFAIVGGPAPGYEYLVDELHSLALQNGLQDKVIFEDFRSDIPSVLEAFDIFVMPSTLPDPFPTVVLEAMASGTPVVANAHGGSVEMVKDKHTGILVDPNDVKSMALALIDLLNNGFEERRLMGRNGRERLESNFSIEAFAEQWNALYQQVLVEHLNAKKHHPDKKLNENQQS